MKIDIEKIKSKKYLYGIKIDSELPQIIKFKIVNIDIQHIFGYNRFIFSLMDISDKMWYATIYEKNDGDKFNIHDLEKSFMASLANKPKWEAFEYVFYDYIFGFNESILKKDYIDMIDKNTGELKLSIEKLYNKITLNNEKIKTIIEG